MDRFLKNIQVYASGFLVILYSLGYIYYSIFYSNFSIIIENYISITDFTFISIKLLIFTLSKFIALEIIRFIILIHTINMYIFFLFTVKSKLKIKNERYKNLLKKILINKLFKKWSYYFFIGFIFLTINKQKDLVIFGIFILMYYIYFKPDNLIKSLDLSPKGDSNLRIMIFIFLLFAFFSHSAKKKAEDYKVNIIGEKYKLYLESDTVDTNNNLILIGETGSHLFLYNRTDSLTTIYPRSEINKIETSENYFTIKTTDFFNIYL